MKYPPLTDSDADDAAEGGRARARPSPDDPSEPVDAMDSPISGIDDLDEGDLEELNEQVDLDDLDDLAEIREDPPENVAATAPDPTMPPTGATALAPPAGEDPIPMLTEVVQVPRYDSEDLPQTFAEVDWGDLGQRVRENVLERLLRRSDALLDAQLQDTLAPVLERAAETVAHELHDALNRMIRDIVARAVTEELTRLHAEIAKRNRASRAT